MCAHVYTHIYTYIYIHTYTYIHRMIFACTLSLPSNSSAWPFSGTLSPRLPAAASAKCWGRDPFMLTGMRFEV